MSALSPEVGVSIVVFWFFIFLYRSISKTEKRAMESNNGKKNGVDGWLLFFIGILFVNGIIGFVSLIFDIADTINFFDYYKDTIDWPSYLTGIILTLATNVFIIFSAKSAYETKKNARLLVIFATAFQSILFLTPFNDLKIGGFIFNILILLYFLTSERVKKTYSKSASNPKALEKNRTKILAWISIIFFVNLFYIFTIASSTESVDDYVTQRDAVSEYFEIVNSPLTDANIPSEKYECSTILAGLEQNKISRNSALEKAIQAIRETKIVVDTEECTKRSERVIVELSVLDNYKNKISLALTTFCEGNDETAKEELTKLIDETNAYSSKLNEDYSKQLEECYGIV